MNKNIKRAVAIGLVGVALVAGGGWYLAAGNAITRTKAFIDRVNTTPRSDGSKITITYESLSRTGFPGVGVRLTNPNIEINSPGIADPNADAMTPPQPLHITWKHQGTVDVVTDYLSHEYRLINDGSGTGTLESGDEIVGISSAPAHSQMALKAKNSKAFTAWENLDLSDQAAVKQAIGNIGEAHLAAGPMKVTDTATSAVILTQDEGKFDLVNRSDDKNIDFDLTATSKGSQVTKEYGDFMTHAMTMLHLPSEMLDGSMPMAAARAGKQDIDIAMQVNLPDVPRDQPTPNGVIHVSKFSMKNDFYHIEAPFDVVLREDAAQRHATMKTDWLLDVTPLGADEMRLVLDKVSPLAPMMLGSADKEIDQTLLREKITKALPTVSTLGPIKLVLDVEASVPKPGAENAPVNAGGKQTLTLRQFSFGHKRWGIDAKADAYRDEKAQSGIINATLTCKQCTTLTQDIFETARAFEEVIAFIQPDSPQFPLTEAMLTSLNTALAEIGKPGAAMGDLDFVVTTPAANDVRLNDKPLGEILPKLMAVFAPPAPAEQATPVPEEKPQQTSPGSPAI